MSQMRHSVALFIVFACGLLFGLGLTISGMINPAKVIGFLDLAGDWDPSLILVMGGGLAVALPAFQWVLRRSQPFLQPKFYLPTRKDLDPKLLGGAVVFGLGWGLAGLCPGPALTALVTLNSQAWLFVAAMLGGMYLHRLIAEKP
ncbi:MAG: hypothetical protein RLZZ385_1595 [Pseudomonadota bacterium]|jgi:uncharacterized membrane protein YedE/YeeE